MTQRTTQKIWLMSLAGLAVGLLLVLVIGWGMLRQGQTATQYPEAAILSENSNYTVFPVPSLTHNASYMSDDQMSDVYNWYSQTFDLGVDQLGQGNCSHLWRTKSWFLVVNHTSVTLCDTPNGRMAFVQRVFQMRF